MKKINYLKIVAFIILISLFIVFIVNTILKFSIKRSSTLDSETLLDIEHFLIKWQIMVLLITLMMTLV